MNLAVIRLYTLYETGKTSAPRRRHSRVSNCGLWYPASNRAGLTEATAFNAELHALPEVGYTGNTKVPFQRAIALLVLMKDSLDGELKAPDRGPG